MDYQTLMDRRGIENEIRQLERDIVKKEAEANAATSVLSHSPRAPGAGGDKVGRIATELVYLRGELEKCEAERREVQEYISSIVDSTMRTAVRKYFVQGKSWATVAAEMNYDESGIRRKVGKFLGRKSCRKIPHNP